MKSLAIVVAMLVLATNVFAETTEEEKRLNLEAAREKMETARAQFEEARRKLDVDISSELQMAREAMDAAAETLAELHVRGLDLGPHNVIKFKGDHHVGFDGAPKLGLVIGMKNDLGGVKLVGVTPGSGAQKAGLAAGDRVIEINGAQLKDLKGEQAVERLVGALEKLEDGDLVNLVYVSDGKIVKKEVAVSRSKNNMWSFIGELGNIGQHGDFDFDFDFDFTDAGRVSLFQESELELSDIDAVMGHYFGVKKGVLVIADKREENGFLPGDIIKSINGSDVESTKDALKQLAQNSDDLHKVKVIRKGRNKNLAIANIKQGHMLRHSSFFWGDDDGVGDNKEVIIRRIGGGSPKEKKAARIVIEKKVIKTN